VRFLPCVLASALVAACGARSGLREPSTDNGVALDGAVSSDAPPEDVPLRPPDCGTPTPVGATRFVLDDVVGHAAIDDAGNVYAPIRIHDGRDQGVGVLSVDACGRERWRVTAVPPRPGASYASASVRLSTGGDVLLTDVTGPVRDFFRYDTDGSPRPRYRFSGDYVRTISVPSGRGPLLAAAPEGVAINSLQSLDLAGTQNVGIEHWSNVNECAVSGSVIGCLDRAYDLDARSLWWGSDDFEILDGTLRHALPPALDRDRLYAAFYGISSYVLEARELRTGRVLFRTMLARSTRGQSDLLMGAPVLGTTGLVYTYLDVHRAQGPDGQLEAFRPDGSRAWGFPAPATRQDFTHVATHLVGRAGAIYLAVGGALYAVNEDGSQRWTLAIPAGANAPELALARDGGLAVHTDDDRLWMVATESAGLAPTPWPATGGDARNGNAR